MSFLMPENFVVIAGEAVVERIRAARASLPRTGNGVASGSLCAQQEREARAGVVGVELVRSNYGWSVRYDSGLQDFGLVASARAKQVDGTFDSAAAFAVAWVAQDPDRRYAHARRNQVPVGFRGVRP